MREATHCGCGDQRAAGWGERSKSLPAACLHWTAEEAALELKRSGERDRDRAKAPLDTMNTKAGHWALLPRSCTGPWGSNSDEDDMLTQIGAFGKQHILQPEGPEQHSGYSSRDKQKKGAKNSHHQKQYTRQKKTYTYCQLSPCYKFSNNNLWHTGGKKRITWV